MRRMHFARYGHFHNHCVTYFGATSDGFSLRASQHVQQRNSYDLESGLENSNSLGAGGWVGVIRSCQKLVTP